MDNVRPFQLPKDLVKKLIREAAIGKAPLEWTEHFGEKIIELGVSSSQVLKCLEHGKLKNGPDWDRDHQNWTCRICSFSAGDKVDIRLAIDKGVVRLVTVIV